MSSNRHASTVRCIDCGLLARFDERTDTYQMVGPGNRAMWQGLPGAGGDRTFVCFVDAVDFRHNHVQRIHNCPEFMKHRRDLGPKEHLDLKTAEKAEQAYWQHRAEDRAERRRQHRTTIVMGILTILAVIGGGIIAALIGRGVILG